MSRTHAASNSLPIIRTGGVATARDLYDSLEAGASLVQWYTGHFEEFARLGHRLYQEMWDALLRMKRNGPPR